MKKPIASALPKNCTCKYQKEQNWGYEAFKWHRNQWKAVGRSSSVLIAFDIADKFKTALILCRGCGKEFHRDPIPPKRIASDKKHST